MAHALRSTLLHQSEKLVNFADFITGDPNLQANKYQMKPLSPNYDPTSGALISDMDFQARTPCTRPVVRLLLRRQ